jgi:hypothetical protein
MIDKVIEDIRKRLLFKEVSEEVTISTIAFNQFINHVLDTIQQNKSSGSTKLVLKTKQRVTGSADTLIGLNDVIGVFKNRKKFHIAKPVRDRIINYFQNHSQELNSISPNEQKKMQRAESRIEPRGLLEGDSVDKTAVPDTFIQTLKSEWRKKVQRMKFMSGQVAVFELESILDSLSPIIKVNPNSVTKSGNDNKVENNLLSANDTKEDTPQAEIKSSDLVSNPVVSNSKTSNSFKGLRCTTCGTEGHTYDACIFMPDIKNSSVVLNSIDTFKQAEKIE